MPATNRKRAVLGSVFVAATVALAPFGFQQASAATPSETHVGTSVNVPTSDQDYRRGFKDGFKSGFRQGQRNCNRDHDEERAATVVPKNQDQDYRRGFKDGFKSGFRQGQRSC
ncbi:hypothetical protein [Streptomyces sp. NPDC002520]